MKILTEPEVSAYLLNCRVSLADWHHTHVRFIYAIDYSPNNERPMGGSEDNLRGGGRIGIICMI